MEQFTSLVAGMLPAACKFRKTLCIGYIWVTCSKFSLQPCKLQILENKTESWKKWKVTWVNFQRPASKEEAHMVPDENEGSEATGLLSGRTHGDESLFEEILFRSVFLVYDLLGHMRLLFLYQKSPRAMGISVKERHIQSPQDSSVV
ncbi:unnamed protein product [Natator depressus]